MTWKTTLVCRQTQIEAQCNIVDSELEKIWCPSPICNVTLIGREAVTMYTNQLEYFWNQKFQEFIKATMLMLDGTRLPVPPGNFNTQVADPRGHFMVIEKS